MRWGMIALCLGSVAAPLAAQSADEAVFVTRLGHDTLAVEQIRRTDARIEGRMVVFSPATRRFEYSLELTDAGTVHAAVLEAFAGDAPAGARPALRVVMERHETRVTMITSRGGQVDTVRFEVPPATIPQISNSMASYEQMARQATRQGGERVAVDLLPLGGGTEVQRNEVVRWSADTVGVDYFGSPHLLHVDSIGRLLGVDGSQSTFKIAVERVPGPVDIQALAAAGAARDRSGTGLGALSTRDTTRAAILGAELSVDYGRPAVRGRQILGGVVPFGEVWRTGANAPTMFSTSRDVRVGDRTIPAGRYTLLSLPSETGAEIIFSRQPADLVGHDPVYDLARIPAEVGEARTPVERLTITIEPRDGGAGVLVIAWHTFVWRVPLSAP